MASSLLSSLRRGQSANPPRIMLVGVEGVGKSTAGAFMPSPVFLCGEDGLVGPQFDSVASFTPSSWAEALQFVDELCANPSGFRSLVVDTLDWLEPMLYAHVCAKAGPSYHSIEDFGFGKGYVAAVLEARQLLARLERLQKSGFSILILAHSAIKMFNNPSGENYDRFIPKCNEKLAGLFTEWCDAVLFAEFETVTQKESKMAKAKAYGGAVRIVHTTHSAAWNAKNRFGLPDVMPLDMPSILDAIGGARSAGTPSEMQPLLDELQSLLPIIPAEKAEATRAWLSSGSYSIGQLAVVLNKCRGLASLNPQNTEVENA